MHRRWRDFDRRFHEGLNLAAVEKLPLVVVVANNQYAYSTPNSRQFACADLVDSAIGYGVRGHKLDGTDLAGVPRRRRRSRRTRPRRGAGRNWSSPSLLRLVGHGEHDDAHYVDPRARKFAPIGRDCLDVARTQMARGRLDERRGSSAVCVKRLAGRWTKPRRHRAARAASRSESGGLVRPGHHDSLRGPRMTCPRHPPGFFRALMPSPTSKPSAKRRRSALADDPRVYIYGQDVGEFGGAFKATKGLAKEFPGRVLDCADQRGRAWSGSPSARPSRGCGPIIEMQFADFSTVGFNQIVNHAATLYWRTNVPCPITIRLPSGGTAGARAVSQPEHGGALRALSRASSS